MPRTTMSVWRFLNSTVESRQVGLIGGQVSLATQVLQRVGGEQLELLADVVAGDGDSLDQLVLASGGDLRR